MLLARPTYPSDELSYAATKFECFRLMTLLMQWTWRAAWKSAVVESHGLRLGTHPARWLEHDAKMAPT